MKKTEERRRRVRNALQIKPAEEDRRRKSTDFKPASSGDFQNGPDSNSFKHAGLDRNSRSGLPLNSVNMAYSLDIPQSQQGTVQISRNPADGDTIYISHSNREGPAIATAKVVLTMGGERHDAPAVAGQCLKDWDLFLNKKGVQFATE